MSFVERLDFGLHSRNLLGAVISRLCRPLLEELELLRLASVLVGLGILVVIVVLFGGAIQTFKRQPIVAILCVIFLLPIWIIWAIIEIFLPDPDRR